MSRFKLLILALVICLTVVFVYELTGYLKDSRARNILLQQINTSAETLRVFPPSSLDVLTVQQEKALRENQSVKPTISGSSIDSTEIINSVLKAADGHNLAADPINTEQWMKRTVGSSTYSFLPLNLTVTGKLRDIILFINTLGNRQLFTSLAVEDLEFENLDLAQQANPNPVNSQDVTAKMTVLIVTRINAGN
jgi:hypothetical protein